jgi:hypothetical protein
VPLISFSFAQEFETTDLGYAAYEGRVDAIDAEIRRGVDWRTEKEHLLHGALFGNHVELAKKILAAGSPVTDDTYPVSFQYCPEFLQSLPPRPEILQPLERKKRKWDFNQALVDQDLAKARELLEQGAPVNEPEGILAGGEPFYPIHYAVRKGNLDLIRLVVDAGADVNVLTPKEGKSPLRLIAENILLSASQRRNAYRFLKSRGAMVVPGISSTWDKILLSFGLCID